MLLSRPVDPPEGLVAELTAYVLAVGPRVVPREGRRQRTPVTAEQDAGLGHAGDADGERRATRVAGRAGCGRRRPPSARAVGSTSAVAPLCCQGVGTSWWPRTRRSVSVATALTRVVPTSMPTRTPGDRSVTGRPRRAPAAAAGRRPARHPGASQRPADHGTTKADAALDARASRRARCRTLAAAVEDERDREALLHLAGARQQLRTEVAVGALGEQAARVAAGAARARGPAR